jgi:hypothetical protein
LSSAVLLQKGPKGQLATRAFPLRLARGLDRLVKATDAC